MAPKYLVTLNGSLSRWGLWLSTVGLILMTAIIGWQVWGRYVLNDTPVWSERLSLLLMNYYILLAAAIGVRERFHLGLVFVKDSLPPRARYVTEILINLLVGGFGAAMVWYGGQMAWTTWGHVIPTLGLPTGASYLPFPIAGTLIVLFSVQHILTAGDSAQEVDR